MTSISAYNQIPVDSPLFIEDRNDITSVFREAVRYTQASRFSTNTSKSTSNFLDEAAVAQATIENNMKQLEEGATPEVMQHLQNIRAHLQQAVSQKLSSAQKISQTADESQAAIGNVLETGRRAIDRAARSGILPYTAALQLTVDAGTIYEALA